MKKTLEVLLFLIIVGSLIFSGVLWWQKNFAGKNKIVGQADVALVDQVATAKVDLPDMAPPFNLQEGGAEFALADSAGQGSAFLASEAIEVVVGGQPAAIAVLTINTGGSGVFNTVVLFKSENGQLVGRSGVNIGDRIVITKIEATPNAKGDLTIKLATLDRAAGEPMAAEPTTPKTVTIMVRDGKLDATTLVTK